MTSLEFILDMDVDIEEPQNNKKDGPSSTPGTRQDRDISASDHANPEDYPERLITGTKEIRGNPGRHIKSLATVVTEPSTAASSSSTARPTSVREDSNTSNEEMYRHGSHPSGSGPGEGEQPNRPMGNPSGDVPIKLTPITGRVSRAKKGVPVHVCEVCRPPKTFTRAEHLRRHQLSHQTPGFPCAYPGCDRAFHRADLLARHATRHDQEGDKASSTSRGTTGDTSRRTSTTSTSGGYDIAQGRSSSQGAILQGHDMTSDPGSGYTSGAPYHQYSTSGAPSMSPPQAHDRRASYQSNSSGPSGYAHPPQIPTINQPLLGDSSHGMTYDGYQSPRTTQTQGLLIVTTGLGAEGAPSLLAHDLSPWQSSDSAFSTPDSHRRQYQQGYSSPTSTSEWNARAYASVYTPTPQIQSPHLDVLTSAPFSFHDSWAPSYSTGILDPSLPLYGEDHQYPYPQFSSVRSPTPPNTSSSVQSAESLVTIAPAPQGPRVPIGRFKAQAAFLGHLSQASFLTAVTLPKATRDAIPQLLDVYWKRFDNLFPLVHRRKFETAPDEILRAAMAAMGSQFLDGKDDRIRGNQLHEWAWQEVKRILQWNVSTMQTIVLCEIFARFRGKRAMIKPSEPFRSLYSRVDTITQSSSSADADTSFGSVDSTSSVHRHASITPGSRWAEWTEAEARRRLLAACFVLDVHTSVYYDLPLMRQFTKPCPPIPLITASQPLWNATPQEWEAMTSTGPTTFEPMVLAGDIISRSRIANSVPLDQAVFLASEALRMPKRPNYNLLVNLIESPRLENVERILALFPGSGVAYTYTALHYTPLHDLLAVSGDSWLFSQKILESKSFVLHQRTLKHWSSSLHAATAAKFAAKALIAYLTINDNGMSTTPSKRQWNMADISDYWAVYVGALICWAIGFRNTTPTRTDACAPSSQGRSVNDNPGKDNNENGVDELEALSWLHVVAEVSSGQDIMTLVNARGRAVVIAIVAMVRRRLEAEAIGSRSRLLVDAVGVLKKLEEGINWIWF